MSQINFENDLKLKKNTDGTFEIPDFLTKRSADTLNHALSQAGVLVKFDEEITLKEFASRIKERFKNETAEHIASEIERIDFLVLVIYNGNHRNLEKVEAIHKVADYFGEAEGEIDKIAHYEMSSKKYQDGVERRVSVLTSKGGELKSGLFQSEDPEPEQKRTIKNKM